MAPSLERSCHIWKTLGICKKSMESIWVNYNISLTWIKAISGWFPLLTMIPVRSQWGRYNLPRINGWKHILPDFPTHFPNQWMNFGKIWSLPALMASLSPARCTMASSTGLWDKVERNVRNLVPEGVAIHLDYGSWLLHMVICIWWFYIYIYILWLYVCMYIYICICMQCNVM